MPKGWWRPSLAEGLGVFIFVFVGAGSAIMDAFTGGGLGIMGIALAHGVAIGVVVSATGHLSGGHLNPAVTFSIWLTGRIKPPLAVAYVLFQLVGGVLAVLLLWVLFPKDAANEARLGATLLAADFPAWKGMLVELALTAFLVFSIFGTAIHPHAPRSIAGFGIGLAVFFDILAGGPLTGASMNPARSLGPALVGGHWAAHWVYWIGPILGASLAALVYDRAFIREKAP